jgi:hypothetical protein
MSMFGGVARCTCEATQVEGHSCVQHGHCDKRTVMEHECVPHCHKQQCFATVQHPEQAPHRCYQQLHCQVHSCSCSHSSHKWFASKSAATTPMFPASAATRHVCFHNLQVMQRQHRFAVPALPSNHLTDSQLQFPNESTSNSALMGTNNYGCVRWNLNNDSVGPQQDAVQLAQQKLHRPHQSLWWNSSKNLCYTFQRRTTCQPMQADALASTGQASNGVGSADLQNAIGCPLVRAVDEPRSSHLQCNKRLLRPQMLPSFQVWVSIRFAC